MREFAEAGYQAASLNRIIRACGMSKSSFYYYVDSKDALFDLVVTELGERLLASLDPPEPERFAGPEFWTRLGELTERLLRQAWVDPPSVEFGRLFSLADAPTDPERPMARFRAAIDHWLERVLDVGRAAGTIRDDLPRELQRDLAIAVLWTMDAWTLGRLRAGEIVDPEQLAAAEVDALRRLLAPG